ncbi:molybdate ABC transporter permease subunit, partial [Paenibacillus sp. 28ISP30-2]|nr:molybdate ABC transporter permease subunit [Paenibacillus sp. 28ISP30-2]
MSMQDIDWNEYWPPIRLSLQVALLSSVLVIILGLLVAWSMSR